MNKFSLFNEEWTPKIIGELNDQQVELHHPSGFLTLQANVP
jgi:hypothetical protein|tara:strand:+ start:423 stop:545 length:123 start_codon:yes stop_codon:yes gene_type:complete